MAAELSIVFGTFDRLFLLRECIASVRAAVGARACEIIVVDGGSTDGTLDYLRLQPDVRLLEHGELRGCVAAYNDGFHMAQGRYVGYLNDDLIVVPGTLEAACARLDAHPATGLVALPYTNPGGGLQTGHVTAGSPPKKYPSASFGVLRRELGERAGWFDGYSHYFGDCHLSLSILDMGYEIHPLHGYGVIHFEADNALRGLDRWQVQDARGKARADEIRFHGRWDAWEGPAYAAA